MQYCETETQKLQRIKRQTQEARVLDMDEFQLRLVLLMVVKGAAVDFAIDTATAHHVKSHN